MGEKNQAKRAFRFTTDDRAAIGFRLVVYANSLRDARQYVKSESYSSLTHRALRYIGEGAPSNPDVWTGAIVPDRELR